MLPEVIVKILDVLPFFEALIGVFLAIIAFNFVLLFLKRHLLRRAKSKRQVSTIKIFSRIVNVVFVVLILMIAFFSHLRSWTGLSVVLGLLTAALGFALQRPITGIAAWVMVVLKRPFSVGDRITIGTIKGDVYDISLTHLYIDEVGGIADSEQHSGRNAMVPNYRLFEDTIINHTLRNDYVICELKYRITYESDVDRAMEIAYKAANRLTGGYCEKMNSRVNVRMSLDDSGIGLKITYYAPVNGMTQIKSDISKEIYHLYAKEQGVNFAYPHTEMVLKDRKDKKLFKKK